MSPRYNDPYWLAEPGEPGEGKDDDSPPRERMSGPPISGTPNYERDQTGNITTRGEFPPEVKETPLPLSEGLASRRRCRY